MMRLFFAAVVLGGWTLIAGPAPGEAQEQAGRVGAETAANVVEAILAGRDDPAAWGALETALGTGVPEVQRGGVALPTSTEAWPVWMRSSETQRVVAGVVAALLALLLLFTGWQSLQLVERAFRAITRGDRQSGPLVRRRHREQLRSRDAERLQAQLRARGAT